MTKQALFDMVMSKFEGNIVYLLGTYENLISVEHDDLSNVSLDNIYRMYKESLLNLDTKFNPDNIPIPIDKDNGDMSKDIGDADNAIISIINWCSKYIRDIIVTIIDGKIEALKEDDNIVG